jgi:hypothetical protein
VNCYREGIVPTERATTPEALPATAVVRISGATFDPSRFAEVDAMSKTTSEYISPVLARLPGLIHLRLGAGASAASCADGRHDTRRIVGHDPVHAERDQAPRFVRIVDCPIVDLQPELSQLL